MALRGWRFSSPVFPTIDELILKVHPILLGSGIQMFASQIQQTALKLVNHQIYTNGFMLLHYQIQH
ncbi:hypothetical protein Q2T42_26135 [Leptolyngbya boryana CZ1]|uniref:Bacterial bifunctional deaminase-reductase C-terminal domain-containing protein n=1 Tax=Leptolyngbya boryana CZ1 TaxID=3060204 RepID=A0AA96WTH4_LEPBY|nr:hypothetical protein [Leptolyngbya boryana]WNZ45272.1 hypothetical protein Q2T42_26135 [Leptolyngbya boryana CZ1]